jgi:hypothetical protein
VPQLGKRLKKRADKIGIHGKRGPERMGLDNLPVELFTYSDILLK